MDKNEAVGTRSQEYYWEQEKQLFTIRRFFYEHNLLPKDDSYFPDDVIGTVEQLQAELAKYRERVTELESECLTVEKDLTESFKRINGVKERNRELQAEVERLTEVINLAADGIDALRHIAGSLAYEDIEAIKKTLQTEGKNDGIL